MGVSVVNMNGWQFKSFHVLRRTTGYSSNTVEKVKLLQTHFRPLSLYSLIYNGLIFGCILSVMDLSGGTDVYKRT